MSTRFSDKEVIRNHGETSLCVAGGWPGWGGQPSWDISASEMETGDRQRFKKNWYVGKGKGGGAVARRCP